jgi:LysM repeat protein
LYSYYVIKKGDTLYSIASRFNTTVAELRNLNNLSPNKTLMPGEVITVPVNQDMMGQNNNIGNNNDLFTTYTVQRGDNLYNIAEKYNISPNTLMMINGINSKMMLTPGQNLLVPRPYIRTYLTQNGDTIQSIMQDKRISISNLLNYNKQIYLLPNQLLIYRDIM